MFYIDIKCASSQKIPAIYLDFNQNIPSDIDPSIIPATIFIGVNKTGCSTFQTILEREYGESSALQINPNREPRHSVTIDELRSMPEQQKSAYKSFSGHMFFHWNVQEAIGRKANYVTFLRNPVERVISFYFYLMQSPPKEGYAERVQQECKSLEDFVVSGYAWNNLHVRYLCSVPCDHFGPLPLDALESAKNNLMNNFREFGLTEKYEESLTLMKNSIGWRSFPYFRIQNVTEENRKRKNISAETIKLIEEYNCEDIELYNFAFDLFNERISRQDSSFFADVEYFKLQNEIVSRALSHPRNDAVRLRRKGEKLLSEGNAIEAQDYFEQAIHAHVNYVEVYNSLGSLYESKKDFVNAVRCFQKGLKLNPLDRNITKRTGSLLFDIGQVDDAEFCFESYLKKYPDKSMLDKLNTKKEYPSTFFNNEAYHLFNSGKESFDRGDFEGAKQIFENVIHLNPELVEAYNMLGLSYMNTGVFEKALECFNEAQRINPFDRNSVYYKGELLVHLQRFDGAKKNYNDYLDKYPGDSMLKNKYESLIMSEFQKSGR